jgi:hypothetical protein
MDFKEHPSRDLIKYLNVILALQSLALLFFLLFDISESKNNYFLWYSKQRLILILIFFLVTAILIGFFMIQSRAKEKINRILTTFVNGNYLTVLVIFFSIILLSIVILYSIPKNLIQFEYLVYYDRLQPVLFFISFSIIEIIIALYLFRNNKSFHLSFKNLFKSPLTLIFILTFLFFFVIVVTGIGNQPDPLSWRQLGSPLLTWQIIFSVFIGLIYGIFESKFEILKKPKYVDLILVSGIFIIAVSSWLSLPLQKAYTAPLVRPPNMEVYPYSDALFYSLSAESVLSGYGIYGSTVVPRPLFITELVYIFALASGDYSRIITLQTLVLALIPILLFLIGKSLNGKSLGISLALLSIFREYDAIRSTPFIPVSNTKLILSDLPALLAFLILTLLIINWVKGDNHQKHYPILIGGMMGLMTLIRTQSIILLPFILIFAIIKYRTNSHFSWLKNSGLIILTLMLTISPWLIRNYNLTGQFIFDQKEQTDFVASRYAIDTPLDETGHENNNNLLISITSSVLKSPSFFISFLSNHFMRNVICTLMVMPPILNGNTLDYLFKYTDWWSTRSLGLSPSEIFGMLIILTVIVFGIIRLFKKNGVSGLIPLFLFVGYNLSNGLARNSGGRYNLPIDWVGYTYFSIGLLYIFQSFYLLIKPKSIMMSTSNHTHVPMRKDSLGKNLVFVCLFVFISSLIPITEAAFPKQLKTLTSADISNVVQGNPQLSTYVDQLIVNPTNSIIHGKALYPRFYLSGQGEPGSAWVAYSKQQFDRIGFQVIYSGGRFDAIYSTKNIPEYFPNRMEVILIGEFQTAYIGDRAMKYFAPDLILFPNTDLLIYYSAQTIP